MADTDTTAPIRSDIDHAVFLGNPLIDGLFAALATLSAEVWSNRRRTYALESLLAARKAVPPDAVEGYIPTPIEEERWKAERDAFIRATYAPFLSGGDIPFTS